MDSEANHQLHILFFPYFAYGHMIPIIDMAKLFAARGVKTTIILTPVNASVFSSSIDRERSLGLDIHIQVIRFPGAEAGLPEGVESIDDMTSPEMLPKLLAAIKMLQQPLEKLIQQHRPDSIVADSLILFATEVAIKYCIPRFVFHGTSFYAQCVDESLKCHRPYMGITSDREAFLVPGLPDKIEMTRLQLSDIFKSERMAGIWDLVRDAEQRSYGILVNSFNELEPAYAMHYDKVMGKRAWAVGPVSLRNRDNIDKVQRGKKTTISEHAVLNWLDTKELDSVLYICFGSMARFSKAQLLEIAVGLEDSGISFIWVVRTIKKEEEESFLPTGFEDRMEGKGLIIREWAPQVLILDHPAVGGFMTHCGWNSTLEGLSAGVPMITWPMFGEQFHNENFITQVLKVGIKVGVEKWSSWIDTEDVQVKKEKIANVVSRLMGDGEEGKHMRMRAKELGEKAKEAVEQGGSSYERLTALIQELEMVKNTSPANVALSHLA
ncbi:hypothetical protein MKW94_023690 [Papaver nudicaule]|uniref:Glycosyltransferase n=1 Tax=Papaver nudicaule TaxID=74823 RepID=A0AA41V4E5_PAPNU|nr:hypothetical protein [Papaver nudicaule]